MRSKREAEQLRQHDGQNKPRLSFKIGIRTRQRAAIRSYLAAESPHAIKSALPKDSVALINVQKLLSCRGVSSGITPRIARPCRYLPLSSLTRRAANSLCLNYAFALSQRSFRRLATTINFRGSERRNLILYVDNGQEAAAILTNTLLYHRAGMCMDVSDARSNRSGTDSSRIRA